MTSAAATSDLLADEDLLHLKEKAYQFEAVQDNGFVCVVIRNFPLPPAYTPGTTDLLLRLPPNFPMARPDMFWMYPHVRLSGGAYPQTADQFDVQFQGRQWQRWSRHFGVSQWRPGTDNLKTFLGTIRSELMKGI